MKGINTNLSTEPAISRRTLSDNLCEERVLFAKIMFRVGWTAVATCNDDAGAWKLETVVADAVCASLQL